MAQESELMVADIFCHLLFAAEIPPKILLIKPNYLTSIAFIKKQPFALNRLPAGPFVTIEAGPAE
jgi:hypothetical protein